MALEELVVAQALMVEMAQQQLLLSIINAVAVAVAQTLRVETEMQ
jgi:hypothetical protein